MSKLSQNSSSSTEMLGSFSATRITLIVVGGAIVIGIAYFGIIKPVFEFVGIKDSKEDKENKETVEQGLKKPYWNPNFWRNNPNRLSYPESKYVLTKKQLPLNPSSSKYLNICIEGASLMGDDFLQDFTEMTHGL